jgi:hypothetical protein
MLSNSQESKRHHWSKPSSAFGCWLLPLLIDVDVFLPGVADSSVGEGGSGSDLHRIGAFGRINMAESTAVIQRAGLPLTVGIGSLGNSSIIPKSVASAIAPLDCAGDGRFGTGVVGVGTGNRAPKYVSRYNLVLEIGDLEGVGQLRRGRSAVFTAGDEAEKHNQNRPNTLFHSTPLLYFLIQFSQESLSFLNSS